MNDKIQQVPEIEAEQYRNLLDLSSQHLKPSITAQLDQNRRATVDQMDSQPTFFTSIWQPATVLLIPAFLMVGFFLYTPDVTELEPAANDIYADLEILEDENQLEFLAELDVSEWLTNENEGS